MNIPENRPNTQGLSGKKFKFGIIVSDFNDFITSKLLDGCVSGLQEFNVVKSNIEIFHCPGAFEIPFMAKQLLKHSNFDVLIALGCVIKGDTPHFDYVCSQVSSGIGQLNLSFEIPIIFGVLTTNTVEQAYDRVKSDSTNKGFEAAIAAIQMASFNESMKVRIQ